ncbi:Autoinducer 2 sensor kinase/phosphatase LuxQ [Thalassovita gelatinovora]|uniref:histidine kinase n=2 Tax=Thalassovita gelatinovora TaxID=53501 RepID=A0A0P1FF78_THAGE|nr:Autoinducer 2 sensor kinase/phosphatase LuxQ [Thalassovita gelatinovora]SEQ41903.1 PAS/PAC sensor hybrid histidine kinase [Thalassovita gelatinovora]
MVIAAVSFLLVVFQTFDVVRKVQQLRGAYSENVQWSLSQAEVEFLTYRNSIHQANPDDAESLKLVRQNFNIFYSRIDVFQEAPSFDDLRGLEDFDISLTVIRDFLSRTVPVIDGGDATLAAGLTDLDQRAADLAPQVRRLASSGLMLYAEKRKTQRNQISSTLMILAATSTLLMGTLLLLAYYYNTLNRRSDERRRQVLEASQRTRAVISTALDAVIVSDDHGVIEEFNNAAVEIFGYTREEAIGCDVADLIVPDHFRDAHEQSMDRIRKGGPFHVVNKGRVRLDAKRSNGELFPIELALQKSEVNGRRFYIAFMRDISYRIRSEQDLIEARDQALAGEKAKSRFLAVMSHEIRTPLNGLLGNLSLMQETPLNQSQKTYVENMATSGKLLMDHINDVLDIARFEAGKPILRKRPTDLKNLVKAVLASLEDQANSRGNQLNTVWIGPQREWLQTDPGRIQQILINIVSNAIKFTKDGDITVEIHTDPASDMVEFRVVDTGMGISDEDMQHVFDDFVTSDSAYNREAGGTGLGLGIVKRITAILNGEVGAESVLEQGSTFWIRIPMEDAEAPPAAQAPGPDQPDGDRAPSGGKHAEDIRTIIPEEQTNTSGLDILVVEDNEINRSVVREMLKRDGHKIEEAYNGQFGVEKAAEKAFDLILMDISMPVLDGRQATRNIRAGDGPSSDTPIVALTAHVLPENVAEFLQDGMQDVLAKPLMRQDLERIIRTYTKNTHQDVTPPSPKSHAPVPARQLINRDTNAALRESVEDAYPVLLTQLTEELTELVEWLQGEVQDLSEIADRCHKFASSAALFGAEQLRQALVDIELAGKNGDCATVALRREILPVLLRDTLDALNKI